MRTLAIGDIHGCLRAFTVLLNAIHPHPDDLIITLGDYVDRGPDSAGVLDYLCDLYPTGRLVPLRGNHDVLMTESRRGGDRLTWLTIGGDATLLSYGIDHPEARVDDFVPERHWTFLQRDCVNWYETETHFFVHANVDPALPLAEQSTDVLLWRKWRPEESQPHCSGKIMVCGHSRQRDGRPIRTDHAICIDTGCYAGGWLTCLEVETGNYWQANQGGELRKGSLR